MNHELAITSFHLFICGQGRITQKHKHIKLIDTQKRKGNLIHSLPAFLLFLWLKSFSSVCYHIVPSHGGLPFQVGNHLVQVRAPKFRCTWQEICTCKSAQDFANVTRSKLSSFFFFSFFKSNRTLLTFDHSARSQTFSPNRILL